MNRIQNLSVNEIFVQVHKTALFAAIEKGNIDIVKMLLMNNKVDIDIKCKITNEGTVKEVTAIQFANNNDEIRQLLSK